MQIAAQIICWLLVAANLSVGTWVATRIGKPRKGGKKPYGKWDVAGLFVSGLTLALVLVFT